MGGEGYTTCARGVLLIVQIIGGTKRRVFVSFDFERDRQFRDFFINQGRKSDATWAVTHSSQEYDEHDEMWLSTTTGRMKQTETLVVLLGPITFRSPGVLKEVTIAHILKMNIYQIIPQGSGAPRHIPNAGRVVRWDWENVKRAIAAAPRRNGSRWAYAH